LAATVACDGQTIKPPLCDGCRIRLGRAFGRLRGDGISNRAPRPPKRVRRDGVFSCGPSRIDAPCRTGAPGCGCCTNKADDHRSIDGRHCRSKLLFRGISPGLRALIFLFYKPSMNRRAGLLAGVKRGISLIRFRCGIYETHHFWDYCSCNKYTDFMRFGLFQRIQNLIDISKLAAAPIRKNKPQFIGYFFHRAKKIPNRFISV